MSSAGDRVREGCTTAMSNWKSAPRAALEAVAAAVLFRIRQGVLSAPSDYSVYSITGSVARSLL
jgi:hypothetical protein